MAHEQAVAARKSRNAALVETMLLAAMADGRVSQAEMRTLLVELLPSALERSQLSDLIRQLVDIVRGRTTLEVSLDVKNTRSEPLPINAAL